ESTNEKRAGLKKKFTHEVKELLAIFLYLALFFCAFTTYRRLVMAEMGISYFHYGFALIKALVLAKVILLGQSVPFARVFDDRPLIVPTFYKVILFSFFVAAFEVLEHVIGSLLHGEDLQGAFQEMMDAGWDELVARTLVMLVAFIPLFAFTETARALGKGKMRDLFLHKRPVKAISGGAGSAGLEASDDN
ncbi:MAG TPA: hypothetical protein VE133_12375, partial [Candidatus Sulfotelmatobacter sp.]|nr:hypothetical protein [Candidatus Sulfotelmatobacter sp.]